jgi:ATP:corrinoid adenosyltransferase
LTDESKAKTWGELLDEVKVIRQKIEKYSKLALAQELAVTIYCYRLDADAIVASLAKQEDTAKLIRAGVRVNRVLEAIKQGKPMPYMRKRKRRRRARAPKL